MQLAYILIRTRIGKLKIVSAALKDLNEIIEHHEVYGSKDIIALVEVEDMTELRTFIQNKLLIIDGMSRTETLVVR